MWDHGPRKQHVLFHAIFTKTKLGIISTLLIKNLRLGEINKQVHVILTVKVSSHKLSDSKTRALYRSKQHGSGAVFLWTSLEAWSGAGLPQSGFWQHDFLLGVRGVQNHGVWEPWYVLFLFSCLSPQVSQLLHSPQPSRLLSTLVCCSKYGVKHPDAFLPSWQTLWNTFQTISKS